MVLIRLTLACLIAETILWSYSDQASAFVYQAARIRRHRGATLSQRRAVVTSEEVRSRNLQQLEKLRERDRHSTAIQGQVSFDRTDRWKTCSSHHRHVIPQPSSYLNRSAPFVLPYLLMQDLKVVFEDDYIVCVDKPSGVLCVPSEEGIPTLAQAVFEHINHTQSTLDKMVVHRLGMDTSGLVVFAKTMEALRGLNTLFRTRQITRTYEVLVCGHVTNDSGTIDMPLMRDYIHPPFMRVSTDQHQKALLELDPSIVGKKLLGPPKLSQTKYQVISRETLLDTEFPVTRLLLTSVTGRTHQLNVHCAAFGHPIVGDRVYGFEGDAAPNGGLDQPTSSSEVEDIASLELQREIAAQSQGRNMCVHARSLSLQHPVKDMPLSFDSPAPF